MQYHLVLLKTDGEVLFGEMNQSFGMKELLKNRWLYFLVFLTIVREIFLLIIYAWNL